MAGPRLMARTHLTGHYVKGKHHQATLDHSLTTRMEQVINYLSLSRRMWLRGEIIIMIIIIMILGSCIAFMFVRLETPGAPRYATDRITVTLGSPPPDIFNWGCAGKPLETGGFCWKKRK